MAYFTKVSYFKYNSYNILCSSLTFDLGYYVVERIYASIFKICVYLVVSTIFSF